MTLDEYFKLPSSPMKNSPVGKLMQDIVRDDRGISFDDARVQANECLQKAAGRRKYRIYTPKQAEVNKRRVENDLGRKRNVGATRETAKSGLS